MTNLDLENIEMCFPCAFNTVKMDKIDEKDKQ